MHSLFRWKLSTPRGSGAFCYPYIIYQIRPCIFRTRVSCAPPERLPQLRLAPHTRVSARPSAGRARGPMTGWTRVARVLWVTTSPSMPARRVSPAPRATGHWHAAPTLCWTARPTAPRARHRTRGWSRVTPVPGDISRTRARPITATSAPTRQQQHFTPQPPSETALGWTGSS